LSKPLGRSQDSNAISEGKVVVIGEQIGV
jgi:hypothetical protein